MRIERVPISKINPAPYNPRKDLKPGDPRYEALKRSIDTWGLVEPLVWNERTGNLVGGHQRLKVLIERGETEVECVVVDLDPENERALNIALNNIQGEWDERKLAQLLEELMRSTTVDVTLTGFSEREIRRLIERVAREGQAAPELEFATELHEAHNYIVLYFDNELDWQVACQKLGIRTVKALDAKPGYVRRGIGRVVRGVDVIERLR